MTQAALVDPGVGASFTRSKRFLRNPLGVGAAAVLFVIFASSILAPVISPYDPNFIDLAKALQPPSAEHLLGTDGSGRDQLSRLLFGGRTSLEAGLIMIVTAILCGVPSGLLAGYFAKWFDGLSS
jgi:peptide/nickel transport system permease protein